jgi:hypothetical protein
VTEHSDLIESLARHRGFLLHTAEGLTEEQARTASTVSSLTIACVSSRRKLRSHATSSSSKRAGLAGIGPA